MNWWRRSIEARFRKPTVIQAGSSGRSFHGTRGSPRSRSATTPTGRAGRSPVQGQAGRSMRITGGSEASRTPRGDTASTNPLRTSEAMPCTGVSSPGWGQGAGAADGDRVDQPGDQRPGRIARPVASKETPPQFRRHRAASGDARGIELEHPDEGAIGDDDQRIAALGHDADDHGRSEEDEEPETALPQCRLVRRRSRSWRAVQPHSVQVRPCSGANSRSQRRHDAGPWPDPRRGSGRRTRGGGSPRALR